MLTLRKLDDASGTESRQESAPHISSCQSLVGMVYFKVILPGKMSFFVPVPIGSFQKNIWKGKVNRGLEQTTMLDFFMQFMVNLNLFMWGVYFCGVCI